jgi:dihydroorotase
VSFIGESSRVRLRCFLNVSCVGLTPRDHEVALLQFCDVPALIAAAERYPEVVVGVKVRVSLQTVAGLGIRPLELAVRAAEQLGLPVMVHIGQGPPELPEILDLLRPGDIVTHCFTGRSMALAGDGGEILEPVREARERGVLFDVGHGSGSFTFRSAEAALRHGFAPDVISSDVHQLSVSGPVFDLPSCMTKLLAVGMSLDDVVRATTRRPAEVLKLYPEIGTLQPGAAGDVALLELREGEVTLHDIELQERATGARLVPRGTIVAGQLMPEVAADAPAPWVIRTGDWKQDHLANNDEGRRWPAVSEVGE